MNIPKELKIGAFIWTIQDSKDLAYEGQCYGSTHGYTQKIFLDPGQTDEKKRQTVIHEAMHAIWWQTGLGVRYKNTKDLEEEVISAISMGLYQVLKDNDLLK